MLYTAKPLERIYANMNERDAAPKGGSEKDGSPKDEYKEVILPHGRIVTRKIGENYVVQKINSTNMSDYLNASYSPGKEIK